MTVEQAAGGTQAALDSPAAAAMLPSSSLTLPTSGGGFDFLKRKLRNGDLERERDFFFSEADEPAAKRHSKLNGELSGRPAQATGTQRWFEGVEQRDWTDYTRHQYKAQGRQQPTKLKIRKRCHRLSSVNN